MSRFLCEVLHVIRKHAASRDGISSQQLKTQLDFLSETDLGYASAGRRGQRSAVVFTRI